jgi:beta-mannosidase
MLKRMLGKYIICSLVCLLCFSAHAQNGVSLNGVWELSYWPQPAKPVRSPAEMQQLSFKTVAATVPGNVELDLFAAGVVPDPMIGNNVWEIRKYEGYQWCYTRKFPTPEFQEGQNIHLWFGGIDCLADIWLNGVKVGSTDNMLIEHSFDVKSLLEKGKDNEIKVIIRSAVIEAQEYFQDMLSTKGGNGQAESSHIRKAPSSYGWDIIPRLLGSGLWRNVELRISNPIRFTDVHWMTTDIDTANKKASGRLDYQLKIPFDQFDKHKVVATLTRNGKEVYRREQVLDAHASRMHFSVENAELWWPRGYGEAALYEGIVSVIDNNGKILASDKKNIGLRKVALNMSEITTPEHPGEFCFIVNGEKIFIKGTNWVPIDAMHSRDASLLHKVIEMSVDLNCNMLRCWGGNVYEDHAFYDFCDNNGILVWQDFSMACNIYPQDDDFAAKIRKEAQAVIIKLRSHPCIALWSGNNENDEVFKWSLAGFNLDPNRDRISRQVLSAVVFEFDPSRPYLPSSPYYTPEFHARGGDPQLMPERHLWGPRGYYKAPFYTDVPAHFVSEIGYHGCPNRESLEKMFDREYVYPWKKNTFEWNIQWQTKAVCENYVSLETNRRNNLMLNQIKELFGEVPSDLDRFIFASQSVQAEAKKFFIEFWRMDKFRRTGILWWNLRDGWPIVSDAVTDYYCSKKLAYYYIKQVQYDACVMVGDAKEGNHPVIAVNDTRTKKTGTVTVRDVDTKEVLFAGKFVIPVNGKTTVGYIPENGKQAMWKIEYTIDGEKLSNHYLAGKAPFKLKDYETWYKKLTIERY